MQTVCIESVAESRRQPQKGRNMVTLIITLHLAFHTPQWYRSCGDAESRQSISIPTKLKLYNTCILLIFLYGSECWSVTEVDARRIDAVDHWCLRTMLGIKWHQFVRNDEVRRITKQPNLTAIIQSRCLSIFGDITRMDDDADAKMSNVTIIAAN